MPRLPLLQPEQSPAAFLENENGKIDYTSRCPSWRLARGTSKLVLDPEGQRGAGDHNNLLAPVEQTTILAASNCCSGTPSRHDKMHQREKEAPVGGELPLLIDPSPRGMLIY
jgi:hypothetical protein